MFTRQNLITYLLALLIILTINFLLPRMMPGDPLMAIYGDEALVQMTPQLKAELVERFALDQSLGEQFVSYWAALFRGDLGYSYSYNAPVTEVIFDSLPWTLSLVGLTLVISTVLGIFLGIESGWRRGSKFDGGVLAGMMALSGFPEFFLGILLLLLFAVNLNVLPLFGAETAYAGFTGFSHFADILKHLILPVTALVLARITAGYLLTRNTMVGVLKEPYILLARAKGLKPHEIKYRHAGRNSMLPVITSTAIWMGMLLGHILFIEVVFSYPGIGHLTYEALASRDYPVVQGILIISSLFVLTTNFCIDLLYHKLDPRVRHAH